MDFSRSMRSLRKIDVHVSFRRSIAKYSVALASLAAMQCIGCGGGSDQYSRVPISGTVTLDGQPLIGGYVIFEPKDGQPVQSGGMIEKGRFEVPRQSGAIPGRYSVAIFSGADLPPNEYDPGTPEFEAASMRTPGERVPRKFNIDTILEVEVKASEDNAFTFELSSTD